MYPSHFWYAQPFTSSSARMETSDDDEVELAREIRLSAAEPAKRNPVCLTSGRHSFQDFVTDGMVTRVVKRTHCRHCNEPI